ncbi:MAG: NAD(P)(+) transhydrogenase (Re/Si-specific) subunit alpha, partial [Steroidobacter sp.]
MTVIVGVLKETRPNERRVALVPAVADKLIKLGAEIQLETGAGAAVKLADAAYKNVKIVGDAKQVVTNADIVLAVQPPSIEIVQAMKSGAILISFVYAHKE